MAISDHFEEVPEGQKIPRYSLLFYKEDDGPVSIHFDGKGLSDRWHIKKNEKVLGGKKEA